MVIVKSYSLIGTWTQTSQPIGWTLNYCIKKFCVLRTCVSHGRTGSGSWVFINHFWLGSGTVSTNILKRLFGPNIPYPRVRKSYFTAFYFIVVFRQTCKSVKCSRTCVTSYFSPTPSLVKLASSPYVIGWSDYRGSGGWTSSQEDAKREERIGGELVIQLKFRHLENIRFFQCCRSVSRFGGMFMKGKSNILIYQNNNIVRKMQARTTRVARACISERLGFCFQTKMESY